MLQVPHITVIGGGTGSSVVLTGLKPHPVDISTIISVADSGGSTGRLRDEFGFAPVGDLRQALAALAMGQHADKIKELLLYRFSKGSGLEGHNLGNLILTSLQDMTGSTSQAVEIASQIFNVKGHIYPSTTEDIQLVIEYEDGTVRIGEHILDDHDLGGKKITSLKVSPRASLYTKAREAIINAHYVIIGPGDLYGSILPNLVIQGVKPAFQKTNAKLIFVMNLMTRYTQTHQMTAKDHLEAIESTINRPIDAIILNAQPIPEPILALYAQEHEFPLLLDLDATNCTATLVKAPLLHEAPVMQNASDQVKRSYLRHHPFKLASVILAYIDIMKQSKTQLQKEK